MAPAQNPPMAHRQSPSPSLPPILAMTPFECPDPRLYRVLQQAPHATAVLDCGHNKTTAQTALATCRPTAVRIPGRAPLDTGTDLAPQSLVITDLHHPELAPLCEQHRVLVQVTSLCEAKRAAESGIAGLIAKGAESGGFIGRESSYILFQRILRASLGLPLYVQGGIGRHTAAAVVAAGGTGVVLDSQLALFPERANSEAMFRLLQGLDGGETRVVDQVRFLAKPGTAGHGTQATTADQLYAALGAEDPATDIIMLGQDIGLAKWAANRYSRIEDYLEAMATAITGHIEQAQALKSLAADGPLAQHHGTRYPIAQGPMTRVSDNADFALAVAENGALPFLALSLMREKQARRLLEETKTKLGERSWGVGILGFAPAEIRDCHLALIREFQPKVVLIAGGRPSQARSLEQMGIQTYLHVPAPGLLDMFLKDGARGFVFEGRECGGHVGPRMSFPLWEQQIERLLAFEDCAELRLLFAGGIHDAESAAMVAAMTAPLAARGAKIGVLMGTAYIGTHEAVTSGAVLGTYQQQVLEHAQTTLLETAPGHATRCLATPFVDAFEEEKQRLKDKNHDDQAIWQSLEQLNVGRLRIASKGIERQGDELVSVDHERQLTEGMYMIGQVAHMMKSRQSMADLHAGVCDGAVSLLDRCQAPALQATRKHEDLAIVGMACVYPGAPDLDSYWHNIVHNQDAVGEVPADRWRVEDYYDPQGTGSNGKTGCKWGGFIDEIPFNPLEYGIPPQSLAAIEPTQLLALEVAKRALADAGYADKRFARERTSVIFGAESGTDLAGAYGFRNIFKHYLGELPAELDAALPTLTEDSFPGVLANVISGRIANRLDLGGSNYTVDAACASSLAAVELAAKELVLGTSDMVLAGGADLHNSINDYLMFSSVHALSRKGRCRSFDSEADGIVLGEGVAVVVLKRLSDAQRDGDRVYAVLNGIAGASDGKSLGLTAPRKEGQKRTLERAYRAAGLPAGKVGLVEAHGTGTVVGDRTEMQTLTEVFTEAGALPGACTLGSVKSQIGHTKCAAGLAGLIKVAKALHHRILPPTNHVERPNPIYGAAPSPFRLESEARPWQGKDRIGAVSAFGFGGTNFHAVLSEAPTAGAALGYEQWSHELFLLRGETRQAAQALAAKLRPFATLDSQVSLRDLSLTANGDGKQPVWFAFAAKDKTDLDHKLGAVCDGVSHQQVYPYAGQVNGKIAFLFPGQGSQRPHMVNDLLVAFPECQSIADRAEDLAATWFPAKAYKPEDRKRQQQAITDTRVAQPLLGLAGMLTHHILQRFGLQPDACAGHSYGELTALCAAGSLHLDDLVPLSKARAASMLAAAPGDPGIMAAVKAQAGAVEPHIADLDMVVAANHNSPRQTVISGPTVAVEKAMIRLEEAGLSCKKIPVACAFHSPVLAAAEAMFGEHLNQTAFAAPRKAVYANLTAEPHAPDAEAIRETLARHLVSPVLFQTQIENMYRDGVRCFVEVGPGGVLSQLTQRILRDQPHLSLTTEGQGLSRLLDTLAQLAAQGHAVDPGAILRERGATAIDLDAAVPRLHAATWMVNGQIARPLKGKQPPHALKLLDAPLQLGMATPQAPMPTAVERDQAVLTYLQGVREMVQAGRQVMSQYLGANMPPMPSVAHDTAFIAPLDPITMGPAAQPSLLPVGPTIADAVELAEATAAPVKRDVPKTLLAIVADRTGYPEDMLDLDLDLEADLSIDSIKRIEIIGELAEQLGLHDSLAEGDNDAMMETLAAQKTLRAMLAWLEEVLPEAEEPAPATQAETAPQQNMQQLLLEIVSERTGYPEDVLELDLDLEADLSIDSIKRLEIVGELAEKAGFSTVGEDQDALVESLAAMKTLRAIVTWLEQGRETKTEATKTQVVEETAPMPSLSEVSRFILTLDQAPQVVKGDFLLKDKHFLITDDTLGLAPLLAVRLQNHDARVRIINLNDAAGAEFGKVDGLIHLGGLAPRADVADVKTFFTMMQTLLAGGAGYLLAAGGLGGAFGHYRERGAETVGYERGGGLAGLIKTVAKELPEIRTHWVDLDPAESLEHLANYLEGELLADNPLTEVAYKAGERRAVKLIEARLDAEMTKRVGKLQLDKDSVVVITGGARGITAKIALELARQYGCKMELVGRSPWPTYDEDPATVDAEDLRALRKALIQHGGKKSPAEIERAANRILAQREMRRNLAAMESCGSAVRYHALDVRDHAAFETFIDGVYDHHGHIEGVIHGAGVVEDKLLRHKTAASFERVFDTKVFGALVLAKKLRAETRFVVFFSSVAGAFGNRGQVDYAAANDVLDKIAHALQTRIQGRVVSINWGPWAGQGMVSPELEREYHRRGIGLIPIDSGVSAFMNELSHGHADDTQVVLMCAQPESMQ
ncbi:type I polyketide synthase [Acanthopleuribacter pedis]|uniref:SDR family NAD(P)-dependent oxidoreductase n=1 Tax=Acanthopleuribacter pedis TaxID=442870 RepID=A0A8J7QQW2_9BACT|nr:type I polyketide synthase [Acanthopleuribacter pedis]MBO1322793.1 SDR family NAD(P)-dependent oxidoreductase [Acanthopleuribacter pedis]